MKTINLSLFISILLLMFSCAENETHIPKPYGFLRVELPNHEYKKTDSLGCPYQFEHSKLSEIKSNPGQSSCNKNIEYSNFKATIHLSYIQIDDSLKSINQLIEDSRKFAYGHQVKAASIGTEMVINPEDKIYGLKYEITGDAASPLQFYITDSTNHFLRGALYFNATPNYDSLKPYIDFIHEDIKHLITTAKWVK